jgi:thiol-disulfide isomerase/thioredoxin
MHAVVAFLFPQPFFKGPARLEYFTPASFAEMVEERLHAGSPVWLVTFFAPWAPQCLYLEPVIAELSLKYSTENLRFGKIDVSRWPNMAHKYNIALSGVSPQLPTLILFEKGKETARIPYVYEDGRVASGRFRRHDIVQAFDLEQRATGDKGVDKATKATNGGKAGGKLAGSSKKKR